MLLISWSTRPPFNKVLKNRGWQNNWHLILFLVHWHLKSYWCRDVQHVCWYSHGQDKLEMSWQFLWEQFAFVLLWRLESVFTTSLKQDWMLRSLMRWVWKQTTLTVRESRRFKTKRKKLDWTRTKFFCLPSLLPRQGNKDLQAQSASTLAVQTPHTVCTVHSHNLFFFPSRRGCKWKLLICHAAAGGFLLVPEESERIIQLSLRSTTSLCQILFPICLHASLFQGVGSPTNTQSLAYLTTRTYLRHRGLMWSYSPKDGVQTKS